MFEISGDDIASLDDEKLRGLIARLCEAELQKRNLSTSHVTWGGNQNAADGGIDVRVALPVGTPIDGFVPKPLTGFQVKKEDMPPAKIEDEMRPNKVIRPSIQALADQSGAYIIVSSQGSVADSPLTNRCNAMKAALLGAFNADNLLVDFYDRTRIASWVRSHPGLVPWVREQVGRPIVGWQSYGSWGAAPDPIDAGYLFDDHVRIWQNKSDSSGGMSAAEGICQMRNRLRKPQNVVRLVGLSGVGKTRLVQALFDHRIGTDSLDPTRAFYTSVADEPDPLPLTLASQLVTAETSAILVVDNCPPELHERLSQVCRHQESKLSLVTVEYDIREDQPEATEVFKLEGSSPALIEKLIRQRFPKLSGIDSQRIAEFSSGNARIAIALAGMTIGRNVSLAGLTDDQLFQRLFWQRHPHDDSLYVAAQACSLVYSFDGEDITEGGVSELSRLGTLIDKTARELYRHVAELNRRDLVQRRGIWRAVLPHAIANPLAALALQHIHYSDIEDQILQPTSSRFLKSFSRRLGYLHASTNAKSIVRKWLGPGGLLEDIANFDDFKRAIFINVAPVAPGEVLAALERLCARYPNAGQPYLDLLRSLAYEEEYFDGSVRLAAVILAAGNKTAESHEQEALAALFQICLSGTHTSMRRRLSRLKSLIESSDPRWQSFGIAGLKAALKASHFYAFSAFDFGARPRDFGYWPNHPKEAQEWFVETLKLVDPLASDSRPVAPEIRRVVAGSFGDLWHTGLVCHELAALCAKVSSFGFWPEGWLAVRKALDKDAGIGDSRHSAELVELERKLRPIDLVQKVHSVIMSAQHEVGGFGDALQYGDHDIETQMTRAAALAQDLGKAVADDEEVLTVLLPSLVSNSNLKLFEFGGGLLKGTKDPRALWARLVEALAFTDENQRNVIVLSGFLSALYVRDAAIVAALLDESLTNLTLKFWYPYLQCEVPIDDKGVARLKRSLAIETSPAHMYRRLAGGRVTYPIPLPDFEEIVLTIAGVQDGFEVAIEIVQMRLFADRESRTPLAKELMRTGRALLSRFSFDGNRNQKDYWLGEIAVACLCGQEGVVLTKDLCAKLKTAMVRRPSIAVIYYDDLLAGMFKAQPITTLDGICGGDIEDLNRGISLLRSIGQSKDVLALVPDQDLLQWCDEGPSVRYPAMARVIKAIEQVKDQKPKWTNLALQFLKRAPDPSVVLTEFVRQFSGSDTWQGSKATSLESNATLLDQVEESSILRAAVLEEKERLKQWIREARELETKLIRARDESFE